MHYVIGILEIIRQSLQCLQCLQSLQCLQCLQSLQETVPDDFPLRIEIQGGVAAWMNSNPNK